MKSNNASHSTGEKSRDTVDGLDAFVIIELKRTERTAQEVLNEAGPISVIRIRSRLQELGLWSDDDVADFDTALRVRNKVAHGDRDGFDTSSLTEAANTLRRLRLKLEAKQTER